MLRTIITGTGSHIPTFIQSNQDFTNHKFYSEDGVPLETDPEIIVSKFRQITGIENRRYTTDELNTSDIGYLAALAAIDDSNIDPDQIDQIIVAHNFGNVIKNTIQTDAVPSLASRIKHRLKIKNAKCVAYDLLFGCPGWVLAMIHADAFFKAGIAKKALVIGTETLSRVIDLHDRDSMIFSDGAGAAVVEYLDMNGIDRGILSCNVETHAENELDYINMGKSYYPGSNSGVRYIKMQGRKVYEYALTNVPLAMKECLERSNTNIADLKKIFIHQANEKMDEAIIKRLYNLYGITELPKNIMPMSIHWLGNSSVATIPTLFDLVRKDLIKDQHLSSGDVIMFASVGAGMNINAVCYRV
jgi:3-oxoacyl-[acyl-carrier-protein] synthase-3